MVPSRSSRVVTHGRMSFPWLDEILVVFFPLILLHFAICNHRSTRAPREDAVTGPFDAFPFPCGPSGPGTGQLKAVPALGHQRHCDLTVCPVPGTSYLTLTFGRRSTLLTAVSAPEKWGDTTSCRDLAVPACERLSDAQQVFIQASRVPGPILGGQGGQGWTPE